MSWYYYTFQEATGCLIDDRGDVAIFNNDGKPVKFSNVAEADKYLEDNDIRGTVR